MGRVEFPTAQKDQHKPLFSHSQNNNSNVYSFNST